jgi:broad specificity phosphatase PhoE
VGHGAFTWSVARGLSGSADPNGDRVITVAELSAFVEAEVSHGAATLDREQQPLSMARDTARAIARLAGSR